MRVTFVLPHAGMSGGIRVLATYVREFRQRGHDVFVVSQPLKRAKWTSRVRTLLRGQPPFPAGPNEGSFFNDVAVPHKVLRRPRPVLDEDVPDADVVVATWWETAEWVAGLSPCKGVKAHLIQGHEVSEVWPGIPDDRAKAVWRLPIHRMVVSRWLVKIGLERYGQSGIDVVPNGVDLELFSAEPRERSALPTVGFMYSALRTKGPDIAVNALFELRKQLPGIRAIVFGASARPSSDRLPEWIEYHANLPQEALSALYASCSVWLFPSRMEGFGLPLLEAMACRTPVVATPAGAAPEVLAHGGGVLVPHEDPAAMAAAAFGLLTNSAQDWRAASDRAYATAAAHTWERSADLLEQSLMRALSRSTERLPLVAEHCSRG